MYSRHKQSPRQTTWEKVLHMNFMCACFQVKFTCMSTPEFHVFWLIHHDFRCMIKTGEIHPYAQTSEIHLFESTGVIHVLNI